MGSPLDPKSRGLPIAGIPERNRKFHNKKASMPLLKALCQLHGDYGTIAAGEVFDPGDDQVAESLECRGLAYRWRPLRPSLTKVLIPAEIKEPVPVEPAPVLLAEPELVPVRRRSRS